MNNNSDEDNLDFKYFLKIILLKDINLINYY